MNVNAYYTAALDMGFTIDTDAQRTAWVTLALGTVRLAFSEDGIEVHSFTSPARTCLGWSATFTPDTPQDVVIAALIAAS